MISLNDIEELPGLRPKPRALRALEFGAQLADTRQARYPEPLTPGRLPRSFTEERLGKAVPFFEALHGVAPPSRAAAEPGSRQIGEIVVGRRAMGEYVLPTRTLNQQRRTAQARRRGETNDDLAERQLILTMMDSEPLPRLCAAYAYWQATGASQVAMPILETGLGSDDQETFDVAAHALAKMGGTAARRTNRFVGDRQDDRPNSPELPPVASLTVLIHGTFAKNSEWYQPGGSFHTYIKNTVYPDLYSDDDFFFWSGRYSDTARRSAANKLVTWCAEHPASKLRLIAHSHGVNVVNLATTMGLQACTLIHLSPAVHDHYLPEPANVSSGRLFTIRSRIDLVVFIDGGAFDYRDTAVSGMERRRVVAFEGHSESHEQDRWEDKDVPDLVQTVCPP